MSRVRALEEDVDALPLPETTALYEWVKQYEGDKQMLVVIDNCEHLIAPCAHFAAALLERCPNLQMLATRPLTRSLPRRSR